MTDQWGQVQGTRSIIRKDRDAAPKLSKVITRRPGEMGDTPTLVNLDTNDVTLGSVVEKPRKQGTSPYIKVNYKKSKQLKFALRELPDYCKMPFDAGPYSGEGGPPAEGGGKSGDNNSWTAVFNINKDERAALLGLDKRFMECAWSMKELMYPTKAGSKKGYNQENFEEKFVTRLKAGDEEKGYQDAIKVFVEHRGGQRNEDGSEYKGPDIWKVKLHDDGQTVSKPVKGDIYDLKEGAAVVPVLKVNRGMYIMPAQYGVKFTLDSAFVITNLCETKESMPTLDRVNVAEDPAPEHVGEEEEYEGEGEGEAPDLSAAQPEAGNP